MIVMSRPQISAFVSKTAKRIIHNMEDARTREMERKHRLEFPTDTTEFEYHN